VKKDPKVFLSHIIESILLIEEYSKRVTEARFHKNRSLQDAVIRRLEIIGEAVKNLPLSFRSKHEDIPWKQIAGMRDILIHEYFDVDLFLTWKVVKKELPLIKKKLSAILSAEESE
jgi:uncharacterized protein with HEPN domain